MANAIYPKWKENLMQAVAGSSLAGSGTTGVYASLSDQGTYTYNATHQFFSSAVAGIVGTDVEIGATKTYTNGTFDGADVTFASVTGATVEAIIVYVHTASGNTTWQLVLYLDTGISTLPVTPNGGNITVTWDAAGIFTM